MSGSMFHYINLVKQSTDGTDSLSPKQSRPTTTLSKCQQEQRFKSNLQIYYYSID